MTAYSSAKAAELHLARCLAEEGGASRIRVNTVNPDAVLRGSRIWEGAWREERARSYGIEPDELEEHYRQRTTLKVNVLPEDIAEAVLHFASEARAAKSTGNILNVDGGVPRGLPSLGRGGKGVRGANGDPQLSPLMFDGAESDVADNAGPRRCDLQGSSGATGSPAAPSLTSRGT